MSPEPTTPLPSYAPPPIGMKPDFITDAQWQMMTDAERTALRHSRSCPSTTPGHESDCTCGLKWRDIAVTEQQHYAAWRKRATEAEQELNALKQRLTSEPEGLGGKVNAFEALLKSLSATAAGAIAAVLAERFPPPPPVIRKGSSWVPPTRMPEPATRVPVTRQAFIDAFWGTWVEIASYELKPQPKGQINHYGAEVLADKALALLAASTGARDLRQKRVADWCAAAFGVGQSSSIEQRGLRLLEEAIEAYQACGCSPDAAHKLIDYIFAKPADPLARELGGVGITLLALANAAGLSADAEEQRELDRVLAKPLAHFTARNQAKNDAGFIAGALIGAKQP